LKYHFWSSPDPHLKATHNIIRLLLHITKQKQIIKQIEQIEKSNYVLRNNYNLLKYNTHSKSGCKWGIQQNHKWFQL
jgi:hypothetical protein